MTDFGILMSPPMVLALLEGRKTMTRRLAWRHAGWEVVGYDNYPLGNGPPEPIQRPTEKPSVWQDVKPGDLLWIREQHTFGSYKADQARRRHRRGQSPVVYSTERHRMRQYEHFKWRPSIHMHRWASRITIEVTETKMEPVQAISEKDAGREGTADLDKLMRHPAVYWFEQYWKQLHGEASWDANPEVVAMAGIVHLQNIDAYKEAA